MTKSITQADTCLVLDFGGVISRTLFETHEETERALGLPKNSLTWRGPFNPGSDELWQSMLSDKISERDYWLTRAQEVGKLIGKDWNTMQDFVRAARGAEPKLVIRPEALSAINRAHAAGYKLAILSNELDLFYGELFKYQLNFMNLMDTICDATYTQILKPDPRAYTDCCSKLGALPQHCVFVDDQLRNINGAKAVGMQTVHFDVQNPAQSFQLALDLLGCA
jgi:putative hydrolase of the HAD superfamily